MKWKEYLPDLASQVDESKVWRYNVLGYKRELSQKQKSKIKKIETEYNSLKVVAVLDADYEFPDCNMHFDTYLIISDTCIPEVDTHNGRDYVIFYGFVDNVKDNSCSEFGDVGVIEKNSLLWRIF
jgi:hypothetical protein